MIYGGQEYASVAYGNIVVTGLTKNQELSDAIIVLDLVESVQKFINQIQNDAIVLNDAFSKNIAIRRNDTIVLADAVQKSISKNLADAISLDDVVQKSIDKVLVDTVLLADAITNSILKSIAVDDIIALAVEHVDLLIGKDSPQGDSIVLDDSVNKEIQRIVIDAITVTDLETITTQIASEDTIAVIDDLTLSIGKSLIDQFGFDENIQKTIFKIVNDSLTITDQETISVLARLTDLITLSDQVSKIITKVLTDSISLPDENITRITQIGLSDVILVIDQAAVMSVERTVDDPDPIVLSDVLDPFTIIKAVADQLTLIDQINRAMDMARDADDTSLVDVTNISLSKIVNDTDDIALLDSIQKNLNKLLNDTVGFGDENIDLTVGKDIVDTISIVESIQKDLSKIFNEPDTISLADIVEKTTMKVVLDDVTLGGEDILVAFATFINDTADDGVVLKDGNVLALVPVGKPAQIGIRVSLEPRIRALGFNR